MRVPGAARRRSRRLSKAFARALDGDGDAPATGSLLGVEHEYRVFAGSEQVDFRGLIDAIEPAQHLDPGDPKARRLRSGAVLTCDGAEAEIALPPIPVAPGFTSVAEAVARAERDALAARLPAGLRLEGYSTHLSVAVCDAACERLIRSYTRTFAPSLMLLMDRVSSPGLLARPRPGRAELGGEFVDGIRLRSAAAFAVGSVLAGVAGSLPPELVTRVVPDDRRYGWYVDRSAFGDDLYRHGRRTLLPLAGGGNVTAQEHLEQSWRIARSALIGRASPSDLDAAEDLIAGRLPLPSESVHTNAQGDAPLGGGDIDEITGTPNVFGAVLAARHRPGFDLAPVMATWQTTVFVVVDHGRSRRAFASVPSSMLPGFFDRLDAGELDETIRRYLWCGSTRRCLRAERHAQIPAIHDRLGRRRALLPRERAPERRGVSRRGHG